MKSNFNQSAAGKRQEIEGKLANMRHSFNKLAANPDKPGAKGPQLVRDNGHAKNQDDSMIATMVAEGFLGGIYGEAIMEALGVNAAASALPDFSVSQSIDMYDTYNRDRATAAQTASPDRVVRNAPISMDDFITRAMNAAWESDLPARTKLENSFAHFSDMLDKLENGKDAFFDTPANKMARFDRKLVA